MANGIIRYDEGWRYDEGHHYDQPPNVSFPGAPAVVTQTKKGTKPMDMIPRKRAERRAWYANISANIVAEAVKMGVAPADGTAAKALVDEIIAKMDGTDAAESALAGARNQERTTEKTNQGTLRAYIRNWKTLPQYPGSGSEGVLRLKGEEEEFDAENYKPVITVEIVGGQITIGFLKKGVDALAIYCRPRGTTQWTRIGIDTESPFLDSKPVAAPGTPEVREYMARGMLGDVEIGLDSDIVPLAVPG